MKDQDAVDEDNAKTTLQASLKIIWRVLGYLRYFKARLFAKISFITTEHVFRLLLLPWALKVIVDNVILGQEIDANASEFPNYLAPLIIPLRNLTPIEIMTWMLGVGVLTVLIFGMTPNRATGRTATGGFTGARSGSIGMASATLAEGQDTATQSENAANSGGEVGGAGSSVFGSAPMGGSSMGGILGILEFLQHMRLTQSINHFLRTKLTGHILSLPITTLDDQRIGDSTYRVMYDSTSITGIYENIAIGIYAAIIQVSIVLWIMSTSFGNASEVLVVAFLSGPLMFALVTPLAAVSRRRSEASRLAGSSTTSNIEEGMANVLAVQSLGGNKRESHRFHDASHESFKRFRSEIFVRLGMGVIGQLAFLVGQIVFFVLMAGYVIDGTYSAGDYFVAHYYFFSLSATISSLGYLYADIQRYVAGIDRVFRLLDLRPEKMRGGVEIDKIKQGLEMVNVGFSYPDGRCALRQINLKAQLGEMVAFVGATGAGKTTLAYLVPALIQASEGIVKIDGINLSEASVASLRKHVSYIFQETQLFSDSVIENIKYGNKSASLDEVITVAKLAGAHDFITRLSNGYETNLGSITSKLSVGQKQRISIARGLLKPSQILILDEPTSALDPETEAFLIGALQEAAKEKLVIIIAHRLSTIANADRIYFLQSGQIIETGSHNELISIEKGKYRQYVDLQAATQ